MKGYYKKPEETAATIKDGWFYLGDIGTMDGEGYLTIVDRKSDMIIAGGFDNGNPNFKVIIEMTPDFCSWSRRVRGRNLFGCNL